MKAPEPFVGPSAWLGADLKNSDDWIWTLTGSETSDLLQAVQDTQSIDLEAITKDDFALPNLEPRLGQLRDEVRNGRGFVVLRGIPVTEMADDEVFRAFWGIGTHLGFALSQNSYGDLLGHVYDEKVDPSEPTPRGYRTNHYLIRSDKIHIVLNHFHRLCMYGQNNF